MLRQTLKALNDNTALYNLQKALTKPAKENNWG